MTNVTMARRAYVTWGTVLVTIMILAMTSSHFYKAKMMDLTLRNPVWKGWANIDKIFVFGDSWSDSWFQLTEQQPGPGIPFGNSRPTYPDGVAEYGAYWFMYMTTDYNRSLIETRCFARSSGTINKTITPHGSDFLDQVQDEFLALYSQSDWKLSSSLFAMLFGVNDISMVAEEYEDEVPGLLDSIFTSYHHNLNLLYLSGARNFLLLNLPPMDRAPFNQTNVKPAIQGWNKRLRSLAHSFSSAHKDISVFHFDLHGLMEQVIDNPRSFPQTAHYRNTTNNCDIYDWNMKKDTFDPSCYIPLREYLWYNELHPTYPMHEVMAAQIVKTLGG